MLLETAVNMMPNHPNVAAWNYKSQELVVSAFARPSDLLARGS